jgi:hypothetical protein
MHRGNMIPPPPPPPPPRAIGRSIDEIILLGEAWLDRLEQMQPGSHQAEHASQMVQAAAAMAQAIAARHSCAAAALGASRKK